MRVCCPKCRERFDIAHAAVLKEAERLRDRTARGTVPLDVPDGTGNELTPAELEARRRQKNNNR